MHGGEIHSMCYSICSNYAFTSDSHGNIKQFDCDSCKLSHDYGRVHNDEIRSITCSNFSLFTSDHKGHLKQFNFHDNSLMQDYGKLQDGGIENLMMEGNMLITSGRRGVLRQYELDDEPSSPNKHIRHLRDYDHQKSHSHRHLEVSQPIITSGMKTSELKTSEVKRVSESSNTKVESAIISNNKITTSQYMNETPNVNVYARSERVVMGSNNLPSS